MLMATRNDIITEPHRVREPATSSQLLPVMGSDPWLPEDKLHVALNILRTQWFIKGLLPDILGKQTEQFLLLSLDATVISSLERKRQPPKGVYFPITTGST